MSSSRTSSAAGPTSSPPTRRSASATRLPSVLEIATHGGRRALRLQGQSQTRAWLRDRTFRDFILTARMRKVGGSYAGLAVRCPSPVVAAVPRRSAKDGKLYVYAVNRDTTSAVTTRLLLWAETWTLTGVRDVFTGRALKIGRDEEGYWSVPLALAPGDAQLLATDAAIIPRKT